MGLKTHTQILASSAQRIRSNTPTSNAILAEPHVAQVRELRKEKVNPNVSVREFPDMEDYARFSVDLVS